ncbi:Putative ribonuclease H protein At1g65750 [Linum grandiflorum]
MLRLDNIPADYVTCGPATLVLPLDNTGFFSVHSMRRKMMDDKFPGVADFPADLIWVTIVPTKIQVFCWIAFRKRFATLDNLQRRGFHLANMCVLCGNCMESVKHLLLHCEFSKAVWNMASSVLSLVGPWSSDVKTFITVWKGMNCLPSLSGAKNVMMHTIFWYLWIERNNMIFRDTSHSARQVFYKISYNVGRWLLSAGVFTEEKLLMWNHMYFDPG